LSIQVLSSEIINQIAAGEVVERPSHLVKELLENSLDAGSDKIVIEVSEGGRNIRVTDNGSGILAEDLEKALQRHATSKITKTDDLWNLHTFGFRGEALASAAAVSKLTLSSVDQSQKKPSQIQSNFGTVSAVKPSSQSAGTDIKIEDLFENVPARLKFLKSETSEITQIKSVVKALALAHHQVEFKLISNGELQLYYNKRQNKLDRVADVLEKKNLFEVEGKLNGFKCHLVFSSPHEVAKTSKQIWIFAQSRWIQDRALQVAIQDAYRSLLMHGEYPYVALWIECAPDAIDVNIHPTKSQIKFQDPSGAFKAVQNTLRAALERAPWLGQHQAGPQSTAASNYATGFNSDTGLSAAKSADYSQNFNREPAHQNLRFEDTSFNKTQFKSKELMPQMQDYAELRVDFSATGSQIFPKVSEEAPVGVWSSLQVIGQANLTYIVCQKAGSMVFVDQHAAHERVVYESLMKAWKEKKFEVQSYLFPLAIDLSDDKVEALIKHQDEIQSMGFEIEQLGPQSVGIKSAPSLIKDSGLPLVFEKMAQDILQNGGSFAIEKKISDLFATMACHSVIRAGQSLSVSEMQELLKSMDQFALSSFCPHGRPVSVEKTFNELEKLFGRIN
jgi:DNA mismatch repair protein MutL